MHKYEFGQIGAALKTYYPRFNVLPNDQAMELWYRALSDLSVDVLMAAIQKWAMTEVFPPSIAELRAISAEIVNGPASDWAEAWGEVQKAIGRYGIYREAEAMNAMSPSAAVAARRIGWRDICMSENPESLRAQFRQAYQVLEKREMEDRQMPAALKETIALISSSLPALEGES